MAPAISKFSINQSICLFSSQTLCSLFSIRAVPDLAVRCYSVVSASSCYKQSEWWYCNSAAIHVVSVAPAFINKNTHESIQVQQTLICLTPACEKGLPNKQIVWLFLLFVPRTFTASARSPQRPRWRLCLQGFWQRPRGLCSDGSCCLKLISLTSPLFF